MKKTVIFVVLVMVLIGSCAAQNANGDAQRIVGTWTQEDGPLSFVFNINGTGSCNGFNSSIYNGNIFWGISSSGRLYIMFQRDGWDYTFFLSPDGRIMIYNDYVFLKK